MFIRLIMWDVKMQEDCFQERAVLMLADSQNSEDAESNVRWILDEHKRRKKDFKSIPIQFGGKLGIILLSTCFKFRIGDSHLVAEVLRFAHYTALRAVSLLNVLRQMGPPTAERSGTALKYFLDHSNEARFLFGGYRLLRNGNRFIADPLVLATRDCDVECIEILLRYSCELTLQIASKHFAILSRAQVECRKSLDYNHYSNFALLREIRTLFCIVYRSLCIRTDLIDENIPKFCDYKPGAKLKDVLLILSLFLRSVSHINGNALQTSIVVFARTPRTVEINNEFFKKLSDKGYLPVLEERITSPATLKHICRCSVRKALYRAWNLPHGIQELPIPRILYGYLDLKED